MPKVTIAGECVIITSSLKKSEIEKVERFKKKALVLTDEETKKTYFAVGYAEECPMVDEAGIVFSSQSADGEGFAEITIPFKSNLKGEELKKAVAECFGKIISNLAKVEKAVPAVLEEAEKEQQAIIDNIEFSNI